MNSDHLRALAAAVDEGTFDAAADSLRISGSAFSQRIRTLEKQVGQVLLTRTVPVQATAAGEHMLRLARQVLTLEDDALGSLGAGGQGRTRLPIAVNADSLDTWFLGVLKRASTWDDVLLNIHAEDQGHTGSLLRAGTVMAAVTAVPEPVSGCVVVPLGTMRYHAVTTRYLADLHRREDGTPDLTTLPAVDYGVRDTLQHQVLVRAGLGTPPHHLIPSVTAYHRAVTGGLGWGMLPESQMPAGVLEGTHPELMTIPDLGDMDVELHWQRWNSGPDTLDRLTEAVIAAAQDIR